ncbi:hypothetical protein FRB94_014235 [Tulasnella sp. JGI-2019a]|nr:hypothetical protein FRB93_005419 [Tulasnella sp. JGI-2019a]KAG9014142.1 hypothetical protein FRB94_014235 [Tulasnella sp. JGI-2019a]
MANSNNKAQSSSRSHFLQSQADFPSELLRNSVQLRDTSAPFPDAPSDEDSLWPSNGRRMHGHEEDEDDADEVEILTSHLSTMSDMSTNTATPGPSRTQPRGESTTPAGPLRLKEVMHALDQVPRSSSRPSPPPPPRSEADSDLLDSDEGRSYKESMKDVFKRAAMGSSFGDSVATPKEKNGRVRKTSFGGPSTTTPQDTPNQEALSDDGSDFNKSYVGSSIPIRRSNAATFDLLRARLENPTSSIPSTEHEQSPDHSPNPSPRIENLNESVVSFPTGPEYDSATTPSRPEQSTSSPRPRPSSVSGIARPRTSVLSNRNRPLSSYDKDYGEISFQSGEVESSTPLKPKSERQPETEHWDWTRPTLASLHKSQERPVSPVESWEHQRERNWNSPKPRQVSDRSQSSQGDFISPNGPTTPGKRRESFSPGSPDERSRVSSVGSMSSIGSYNLPHGARSKGTHQMSPSPSPASRSHIRSSSINSPTAAEKLQEREKNWNKTPTKSPSKTPSTTPVRTRTTSMPGLDGAMLAASRGTPSPRHGDYGSLGRARTMNIGRASPDIGGPQTTGIPISARARGGILAYQPVQPTSTLIRRSSLINIGAVTEETEPSQSDDTEARPPSPASTIPLPPSPGSSRSVTPANDDEVRAMSSTPQQSQMEKDSSRLHKAMARSTASPAPGTTTPQMSPSRPQLDGTTTPQNTPPRLAQPEQKDQTLSTPSKRSFYEPKELTTPSPPKGGLPDLPSISDEEEEAREGEQDEVLRSVKEPVRGVVVPLRTFGRRSPLPPKTPKFPGAWNTPGPNGNSTISTPPFDDREHPHPKGEALDLKRLEDSMDDTTTHSDSEAVTPVRRPEPDRPRTMSTPQTPAARQTDASMMDKTPAPPGTWMTTPLPRKSIMKVRFDSPTRSSQARTISRPTTPDAVVDDTHKILQALVGITSSSSTPKDSETPRRRARINMVDSLGRDLFASDGTPIKRDTSNGGDKENEDGRRPLPALADDLSKSETSGVELHITTPNKRRAAMRMMNSFGEEISDGRQMDSLDVPRPRGEVDLTSPVEPQDEEWNSDDEHSLHDNVPRVRKSLDGLWGSLTGERFDASSPDSTFTADSHRERLASLGELNQTMEEARQKQLEKGKGLRSVPYAEIPIIELPSASEPRLQEVPKTTTVGADPKTAVIVKRSIPWIALAISWLISVALFIALLHWSGVVERKAEDLFLTTYHDPTFAGFYTSSDPHAPTVSQWLMINGNNHQVSPSTYRRFTSWFGAVAYDFFGSTRFLDTSFRPNLVPT